LDDWYFDFDPFDLSAILFQIRSVWYSPVDFKPNSNDQFIGDPGDFGINEPDRFESLGDLPFHHRVYQKHSILPFPEEADSLDFHSDDLPDLWTWDRFVFDCSQTLHFPCLLHLLRDYRSRFLDWIYLGDSEKLSQGVGAIESDGKNE
jgi:hypothetical protein